MKKHYYFIILSSLITAGCATSTMSINDTKQFKNNDIYSFLKSRFVDSQKSSLSTLSNGVDYLSKALDGLRPPSTQDSVDMQRASDDYERKTTGLMSDGKSVIFNSYYTQYNNTQLNRPRVEIENYCSIIDGKFNTIYQDNSDFISSIFVNPHIAFNDAMQRNYSGTITINHGFTSETHDLNYYKPLIAAAEAEQVQYINQRYDQKGAEIGYLNAASKGAFGTYSCSEKNSNKTLWTVQIIPFSFEAKNPENQLTAHKLKILIIPAKA